MFPYSILPTQNDVLNVSKENPYTWILLFTIASILTHGFFATIWTRPKWFRGHFASAGNPPEAASAAMAKVTVCLRMICSVAIVGALYTSTSGFSTIDLSNMVTLAGVLAFIAGQALNAGVYNALGEYGVYYGRQLGVQGLQWAEGFPYNLGIPDPQYVGVVVSYFGIGLIAQNLAMAHFVLIATIFYCITMFVEGKIASGCLEVKSA